MHLVKKAGYSRKIAHTGSVTLIQRFGRSGAPCAPNLNIHFHIVINQRVGVPRAYSSLENLYLGALNERSTHAYTSSSILYLIEFLSCKTIIGSFSDLQ